MKSNVLELGMMVVRHDTDACVLYNFRGNINMLMM